MGCLNKGGRPPKIQIKYFIIHIIKKLKTATPRMVQQAYENDTGQPVALNSIKKYLGLLVDQEKIARRNISKRIHLYELR